MQTLRSYEDTDGDAAAWRRWLGAGLSLLGFTLLANAFLILLPFGHLLSFWAEVALSAAGGLIGTAGLWVARRKNASLVEPLVLLIAGILSKVGVGFVSHRFGMLGLVVLVVIVGWWANRMYSRVD
jgi:hypothetical protein